jgi:hypothetical protein
MGKGSPMAEIVPFPRLNERIMQQAVRQAILDEALELEAAHDANPEDEEIILRLCVALLLVKTILEDEFMPSERPTLPRDTYARDLAGPGANRNMPLQAGEVATYAKASRFVDTVLIISLLCLAGAFCAFVVRII